MLDREALRDLQALIGGDRADLVDLISGFLDEARGMLDQSVAAAAALDTETVRLNAHSLKSNSRDLGAVGFSKLCAELEADLNGRAPVGDLSARVQEILAQWAGVRAALEAEMTQGESRD